ncbi:hypothetical protein ABK040_000797 [Willaertia magna]
MNESIELFFSSEFTNNLNDYRLFELPDNFDMSTLEIIEDINLQHEDNNSSTTSFMMDIDNDNLDNLPIIATLKGEINNTCNLCTENQTFEIIKVETSNGVFFFNSKNGEICAQVNNFYELQNCNNFIKIREFLENNLPYYNQNSLQQKGNVKFRNLKKSKTLQELENEIQFSTNEILQTLQKMKCLQNLNNEWFLLDEKLFQNIFDFILLHVSENNNLHNLNRNDLKKELLEQYDELLLDHCINLIIVKNDYNNKDEIISLDINKIYFYTGIGLLNKYQKWRLKDFMDTWKESISSLQQFKLLDLNILRGYFILDIDESKEDIIMYVNTLQLPSTFKERLDSLFKYKQKYNYEELQFYFKDIMNDNVMLDQLLKKHTKIQQSVLKKEKLYLPKK